MTKRFIITYTGAKVWPLNIEEKDIDILDIAHALSNKCRFTGHTSRFYSVAEHCILMSWHVPEHLKKLALLHDASETYLPDVATPIKSQFPLIVASEERILKVVEKKFLAPFVWDDYKIELKKWDVLLRYWETKKLLPAHPDITWEIPNIGAEIHLCCWLPVVAEAKFLTTFGDLWSKPI